MKAIQNHIQGIRITFEQLIQGKFLFYFIPGLVITIVYYFSLSLMHSYREAIDLTTGYSWIDVATGWIETGIDSIFSLFRYLFEQFYIFIVLTLLSPFNTSLAEKLDSRLTGKKFSFDLMRFINDLFRMVFVVLIILLMEGLFMIVYFMLSRILGLGFMDDIMYFLIAAFFFGFSFYDFALERYEKGVGCTISYAFEHMLSMLLTGCIFLLIYQIPYIGIPISVVLAVMISTVVYLYNEKLLPLRDELTKNELNE